MKTLNELYKLLLIEFETKEHYGICSAITDLKWYGTITKEEFNTLHDHFMSEKPRLFKNTLFVFKNRYRYKNTYWWIPSNKKPRIQFIKHLIKKTNEL